MPSPKLSSPRETHLAVGNCGAMDVYPGSERHQLEEEFPKASKGTWETDQLVGTCVPECPRDVGRSPQLPLKSV